MGVTAGTSINSTTNWLKFSLDSKTLYVSKKPIRYGITWAQLNTANVIFGAKTIVISGKTYKVRLLKGRGDGLTTNYGYGYDLQATWNSEWNRTMYHVSGKPFGAGSSNILTSEGIAEGDWAKFSEADLTMYYGNGSASWTQDTVDVYKAYRGYVGVSFASRDDGYLAVNTFGWRPCLELVG